MPSPRMQVGQVEIVAITDGEADLPGSPLVDAFPGAPADELLAYRDRFPTVHGAGDAWHIIVRAWLLRADGRTVLMDTGVGSTVAMSWFPEPGRLHSALAEEGIAATDLDTVVLSHVHDDHLGGTVTGAGEPAFPDARFLLQRADRDALAGWAEKDEEDAAVWTGLVAPLEVAGQLQLLDGDHDLSPSLRIHHAPGHTPGHQVLHVRSESARALLSADTWNHPAQITHPDWWAATDVEPDVATATRRAILATLDDAPDTIVVPAHLPGPFGHVVTDPDGTAAWTAIA